MAFDWAEFLAVAEHLSTTPAPTCTREALLRSAVGRAYYAAYGVAKRYAVQHIGFRAHELPDDHERLPWRLINHGLPVIGTRLQELRGWRNLCDYDDSTVALLEQVASDALRTAHGVIDELAVRGAPSI
jgi:hypothetical protein